MPPPCRLRVFQSGCSAASLPLLHSSLPRLSQLQPLRHSTRLLSSSKATCRSVLLAPASPPPTAFASTHASRSWDPSPDDPARQRAKSSPQSPRCVSNAERELNDGVPRGSSPTCSTAPAMSHPYSARAYRVRLQHGNFSSLRELTRAPYAPSPLNVLVDLLRLSVVPPANAEGSASSSKAGVHHALERALDVQWVLHATMAEARDTVLAAETVGDAASHAALQELWSQVDFFSNAIEDGVRGAPGDAPGLAADTDTTFAFPLLDGDEPPQQGAHGKYGSEANSPSTAEGEAADTTPTRWVLPTATYAILLRGVLQLAAITGAHLHAFSALNELIALHERRQRSLSIHPAEAEGEVDDSFSMDDALALVDAAAQRHVDPLTAQDHLYAMEACAHERHRDFRTTLSLYRRFVQHVTAGWFAATPADFTAALVAVAHSSRTTTEFTELRALLVESEAAAAVPVSVPLYTALIDAASRAAEEPQRMSIALSLYRRLRDGALTPTSDTYAALIACCASTRAPTQAFAFYHEARQVCGVANFTPRVYTNLLLSYSTAGYGADARKTLDVLVEAGAPLSRASFHAVLASAVTVREAQEIMELMTQRYDITPTPHTYAYVMQAVAKAPAGSRTALQLFDVHEDALRALARLSASVDREGGGHSSFEGIGEAFALSTSADGVALEPTLLAQYPLYVRALEHALLRLRVDPTQDPRLKAYLTPLVRVAQQRMNAFTGMPPQAPIRVPEKERLCIAVLAADVLANVDEWVMPFMSHYSVLVIPYSAVLALQKGGGRRVEGAMAKGPSAGLFDPVWRETPGGGEHDALVEHRRRRLLRFLADHRDVVHLVSLEEELAWSRETRRYGVGITDLFARAAAVALHLARLPEEDGTSMTSPDTSSVYARHPAASIVLVSANYEKCGKYVVALKQAKGGDGSTAGLQAALRRVSYHNPRTNPNWVPPSLSITHQQQQRQKARGDVTKKQAEAPTTADVAKDVAAEAVAVRADAAAELYQSLLDPVKSTHHPMMGTDAGVSIEDGTSGDEHTRSHDTALSASSRGSAAKRRGAEEEGAMDAALLMSLLND